MKRIYRLAGFIFLLDQIIKYMIMANFSYGKEIFILPNTFYVTYVKNTGGAWSILSGNLDFLLIISIASIGLLGYYIYQKKVFSNLETIYFGFMVGGILGNFLDRLFHNGVVDYIGLVFGNYYFPIFNIADIAIVCGGFLLVLDSLRRDFNASRGSKG